MAYADQIIRLSLNAMLEILEQKPFMEVTVGEAVWGMDSDLVELGNKVLPPGEKLPFDQFGFFVGVGTLKFF